jgi:hypothetical protein
MEINYTDNSLNDKIEIIYTQDWQQYEYEEQRSKLNLDTENIYIKSNNTEQNTTNSNNRDDYEIDNTEMEKLLQYYLDQEKREEEYFEKLEAENQYEITHCCNCNCEIIPHSSFCSNKCRTEWFQDDFISRWNK